MTALLDVHDIHASYGRAQALFGVSFQVQQGQVVTLLGRNGMGRSTTIKCLFGLLPVGHGQIAFGGQITSALPSYSIARLGLGLVPEGRQVFPNLTVEENLVATARPQAAGASAQPWTLQRVYQFFPRLKERRTNLGAQLSGGEQQMLAIGRALMTNPRLLVLDEATEGLAPLIRAEIWQSLTALKAEGLSQIVIDKNVGALLEFADRHYVLEKGRVVWDGNSDDLRADPRVMHQYLGV
ncbi:ABC transporter ATP-binding protein [Eoetvoesiella caeni]|uniref:Amino acid/amide ABC transporter ATP-binding protein 2 (HAAT family) n=1 Tax=Eoetvoesiella caeni TaxID=645616 RepID=A0A366H5P3_9BURK|nr:ABC transporter ATP-binding protein [Eoetvoesiella caeni]MCI2810596.1 ABC transporter ATP-binding protein [Eoetvoesiella caeni]NYT56619.1 ABC transporter ATP-binding protein [Eoetvoesiella caeni]RBP36219.1 amino acid/amide ABC transporter ATP-binding protein 2 (HAAT family) [Eoetvoesiella caeni]